MPLTDNLGVRVHYEVVGDGPALVLGHGSFGSLDDWKDLGYVAALRSSRTLILIDFRGHGRTGKPHDPAAYGLAQRVSDITAVLDALGIATADYMGYSMGGWIGFGLARYAPQRVRTLILGGAHPFAESMEAFRALIPAVPEAFVTLLEPIYGVHLGPAMRARLADNDLDALRALTLDRADCSEVLSTMHMPCLLFGGTEDPRWPKIRMCAERISNARLLALPDSAHVAAFGNSVAVLPTLRDFLDGT